MYRYHKLNLIDEGYDTLAKAIILQAVKDFKRAYRRLKKNPDNRIAEQQARELTGFFCGEYFCLLSDLDGPRLLRGIMDQTDAKAVKG